MTSDPKVIIGRLHVGDVALQFMQSYLRLLKPAGWMDANVQRLPTHHARNTIVNLMMRTQDDAFGIRDPDSNIDRYKEATHVFFVDDDMTFPADALLRLLAHDVPIVSGFYVKKSPPFWPVPMREVIGSGGYTSLIDFCPGLQEVDVVGGGCLLIRRDVIEAIPYPWFSYTSELRPGKQITEDVPFCEAVKAAGFPLLLDFDVQCGHLITAEVRLENWLDYRDDINAPDTPETEKIMRAAHDVRPWPHGRVWKPKAKRTRKKKVA